MRIESILVVDENGTTTRRLTPLRTPIHRWNTHFAGTLPTFVTRLVRAVRLAATDSRIPKPLRWLAALGLLPIPGPFDEIVLLVVAVPLGLFYREPLADAWRRAAVMPR